MTMKGLRRIAIWAAGGMACLLVLGFLAFANIVTREPAPDNSRADGIVVLTGGDTRILEGARLLREGRADRLLISGVNRRTPRDDVMKLSGLGPQKFSCCVDLGYEARDTIGNADETRSWVAAQRYDSLIVVTSSYHMPRSLAELSIALPQTRLIPHPVMPKGFPESSWWRHPGATRILVSEYLKFLPAAARYAAYRLIGNHNQGSIADTGSHRRTRI
jgi:uncharacterized SAM-binding protein YcdF (DUF218 family)